MAYRSSRYTRRRSYGGQRRRSVGFYGPKRRRVSARRVGRSAPAVRLVIEHVAPSAIQRPDLGGPLTVEKATKKAKL